MSDGERKAGSVTQDDLTARAYAAWDKFVAQEGEQAKARIAEHLKAPTYQDEVRSELRTALADFRYTLGSDPARARGALTSRQQSALLDTLLPVVLELVEHAVQISRIERGVLPMDED